MPSTTESWWWDLVPAALGALLGAAAAAIPAFMLAQRASEETLRRDRETRNESRKALAYRLVVKLQLLAGTANNVSRSIDEMIRDADAAGHGDKKLSQKIRPLSGLPDTAPQFDAEELALLLPGHPDMVNRLALAVFRQSALLAQLRQYGRMVQEFQENHPVVAADGLRGTMAAEGKAAIRLQLDAAALEDFISGIPEMAREDAQAVIELAEALGPVMRGVLDDPTFPLLRRAAEGARSGGDR